MLLHASRLAIGMTGELEDTRERACPGRPLAARFAAREAAIKALSQECDSRDVEVVGEGRHWSGLSLHAGARARVGACAVELAVSPTHAQETAGAVIASLITR